ncbi:MAG: SDR family NAD(P)-dependent oxidoreductase, partial [Pseudomonadota bacterium]
MYHQATGEGGIAVVTGAASGVGRVAARRFAGAGLGVVLADLPGAALDEAVAETAAVAPGAPVIGQPNDVTNDASVEALADAAFAAGPVALLMNNAGIGGLTTTPWGEIGNWRRLMDVNFHGVL